jgi:tetratricopeptide (TPR) repeat protein
LLDELDRLNAMQAANADAGNYVRRGGVYNKQGELEKAIADVTKAIELDPANAKFITFEVRRLKNLVAKKTQNLTMPKLKN